MLPWIGRAILIVLDGVGAGALPDAGAYGDAGCNTLGHVAQEVDLQVPALQRLGLGNLGRLRGVAPAARPAAAFGRLAMRSAGKDSTVGHWELAGVVTSRPFPIYRQGFPAEIVAEFSARTGWPVIGNRPASGTQIIEELYEEHRRLGAWILYTSGDSVFQVAAHEEVIPRAELHRACEIAAQTLLPSGRVLRIIARPFTGRRGALRRTAGRRDFSLAPPTDTVLDRISAACLPVVTVGKVDTLFAGRGVTEAIRTSGNAETLAALAEEVDLSRGGLVLANLIDFDMTWGHRRDVAGFAAGLEAFDRALAQFLTRLPPRDILLIAADHGCDPTAPGSDHTREYAPMLAWGQCVAPGVDVGVRGSFADVGATIGEALGLAPAGGVSFCRQIAAYTGAHAERADLSRLDWHRGRSWRGWGVC